MPQPVSYNPGTPVSGSIQENNISYVVDGQQRNYRGGFGGLSWMSEVPAENNVIFIGNSTSLGRGPANIPLFYPAYNNSSANIVYAANTLPGSPRNFTTTGSAYNWAVTNNFFINNSNNPIPRIDADELVLYVDAGQPTSYPQTGTTWYDFSGRNNNGTLVNGPTFDNGGYITFDGVDDYCSFPVNTFNSGAPQQGTFYIRMKFPTLNTVSSTVLFYDGGLSGNLIYLYRNAGFSLNGYSWLIYYNRTDSQVDALLPQLPYLPNTWYDTAFTFNSSGEYRVYVNGELKSLENASLFSSWRRTGANSPFLAPASPAGTGSAQILQWYDRPLTLTEVKQNYFQSNIVQDGLVFMIDANNIVSYPKSGTTLYNLTGSQVGTLTNGVGYSSNNGGYWTFDGVDDYIDVSNPQTLNPGANSITIDCWLKQNDLGYNGIVEARGASLHGFLFILNYPNEGYASFFLNTTDDGNQNVYTSSTNGFTSTTTWINATVVVNRVSEIIKFYNNGIQQGSDISITSGGTVDPGSGYRYEIGSDLGGPEMNGYIASLKQYNKALTPSEVQQNYQATKDKFQGQQIVTNGLVLNLDSANKDSYPGTGTTWTDLSGNGNNGTLTNGPSFLPNVNSGIIKFDGVDDYVDGGTSTLSSGNISLFQWVKMDSLSSTGWNITFTKWLSSVDFHFAIKSGTPRLNLYTTSNSDLYANTALATGVWYYVGFTLVNGGTLTFYVNGTSDGTYGSVSRTPSNDTIYIGDPRPNYGLAGSIPITQVYNRALSATEIAQNYNATKTRFGL